MRVGPVRLGRVCGARVVRLVRVCGGSVCGRRVRPAATCACVCGACVWARNDDGPPVRAGRVVVRVWSPHRADPVETVAVADVCPDAPVETCAEREQRRRREVVELVTYVVGPTSTVVE